MLFCRIHILDCYTDPLGWKDKTKISGNVTDPHQISSSYTTVKDIDKLFSVICYLGQGIKVRFFCTLTKLTCKTMMFVTYSFASVDGFHSFIYFLNIFFWIIFFNSYTYRIGWRK